MAMAMAAAVGPDGLPQDVPAIASAEKALEQKEIELRKFIQDNYSKIRNVEKELGELTFQVKLTAGSKKAALEHLRKKIELSGERIKKAKLKEEQAKKVLEVAQKALKDEEDEKQRLCEDLTRLVEENASAQFTRLEELKKKLEALCPAPPSAIETVEAQSHVVSRKDGKETQTSLDANQNDVNHLKSSRGRGGRSGRGRSRNSLVLQNASSWTGAGFDTEILE